MHHPFVAKTLLRPIKGLSLATCSDPSRVLAPFRILAPFAIFAALYTGNLYAHDATSGTSTAIRADSHAPLGVMGDHMHKSGEWMVSYRFMQMNMEDNILDNTTISTSDIATTVSNPNAPPATLRVTPTQMTTNMHMLGIMYAPNDTVTLMAMLNYLTKEMKHTTYQGMMGANILGTFTTTTSGVGDTKVGALVQFIDTSISKVHINLMLSLPTGSIQESDEVLTPMNMRTTIRTPYGMQLGSGTYDLEPGITYTGTHNKLSWGVQYKTTIHLNDNDENYAIGDKQELTTWGSYLISSALSTSIRLSYTDQSAIDGRDANITAPVSTANPDNYGGTIFNAGIGINYVAQSGPMRGHRFAFEHINPLDQDANGLQLKMQSMLMLGYQYAF